MAGNLALTVALLASASMVYSRESVAQTSCTGPESDVRLFIQVENVRASQGLIAATLYLDDARRFLAKRGSLYVGRVPAEGPVTRMCIYLPKTGTYSLVLYHDADSNRGFNRNGIGLPTEGFGFSNNPSTLFGIPSFRATRVAVPRSDMEIKVRLRYR